MKYVLDTHVWLWAIADPDRIAPRIREIVEDATSQLALSSTSYWELALLHRKKQVDLQGDVRTWIEFAHRELPVTEIPIDRHVALDSQSPELPGKDPADRFIAATARVGGAILLTQDRALLESPAVPTLPLDP